MFILDIVVVLILVLMGFLGYKKGLINMIFSVVSLLIAIIISMIFFNPLSNFIVENTTIDDKINSVIVEKLETQSESEIEENYNSIIEDTKGKVKTELSQQISEKITAISIQVISIIVVFIVTRLVLIFVKQIANAIASLPIIKQFNKLGGLIAGVLKAIIFIYIVFAIIFVVSTVGEFDQFNNLVNNSIIAKTMYYKNIILMSL